MNGDGTGLHPVIASFPVKDSCLVVGGARLDRLAERAGKTPFFAYDRGLLTARMAHLRKNLPQELSLHYAVKANPMPAVVQHLASLADGFDVASTREMHIALDTGIAADRVSFAGPGKTPEEISRAVAAGITIEMESEGEMRAVARVAEHLGIRPRVAIRVNPDFAVRGSSMRMGGGPTQFGVDAERVPQMLAEIDARDLDFVGFHIFAGSQNLHVDTLIEAQRQTVELALRLARHARQPVVHLNIGGGFGVPYFPKDLPIELAPIGANLSDLLHRRVKPNLPEARIILELGRYIAGEAGVYVCRVIDRKESQGQVFLVTDGGLHHQLAASGNFGQVVRRNFPVAIGTRMNLKPSEIVSVVGCLCTPLDLLADKVELPCAAPGDLVVVFLAGAYGLTASPTAFLGHPEPLEMLV